MSVTKLKLTQRMFRTPCALCQCVIIRTVWKSSAYKSHGIPIAFRGDGGGNGAIDISPRLDKFRLRHIFSFSACKTCPPATIIDDIKHVGSLKHQWLIFEDFLYKLSSKLDKCNCNFFFRLKINVSISLWGNFRILRIESTANCYPQTRISPNNELGFNSFQFTPRFPKSPLWLCEQGLKLQFPQRQHNRTIDQSR